MPKGNPNPSPKTRFKPGQSGNPSGIPKERRQLLNEAADMAAQIQHRLLEATLSMMREHPEKEKALEFLNADTRQLMKELLDRAEGTAKQSVDVSSKDGSLKTVNRIVIEAARADSNDKPAT
jgi:protein subunit release factor B